MLEVQGIAIQRLKQTEVLFLGPSSSSSDTDQGAIPSSSGSDAAEEQGGRTIDRVLSPSTSRA